TTFRQHEQALFEETWRERETGTHCNHCRDFYGDDLAKTHVRKNDDDDGDDDVVVRGRFSPLSPSPSLSNDRLGVGFHWIGLARVGGGLSTRHTRCTSERGSVPL